MFLRKKYSFQINKNKDTLTQELKGLSIKDHVYPRSIGSDSHYSVEFNWDEFVVTRKAEFSNGVGIEPDASIRLMSLSENLTQITVIIKFPDVSWVFLSIIQLGIIAGSLFGTSAEWNWLSRIALMIGSSGLLIFILWLILIHESNHLEKVINRLFEQIV